ncbi:MAG TPA: fluoride efflux transporter CrcB [Cyclobacteriaceae bacterium]|nr:fluoride efflux transporter CrcB [Cyclobacteriaceae bacterium]
MSRTLILVGLGGLIGSVTRYLTVLFVSKLIPASFPFGTFAVNFIGCFIIGIVYGVADRSSWFTPELRLFLATGICGGYTTFSAFAYENVKLLQTSDYLTFATYSLVSFGGGLLAVFLGLIATKI